MSTEAVLPEELVAEILSWLPVKTLIRFRCVSKAWNSLTFNPRFIKLHFQRSPISTHLLLSFSRDDEYRMTTTEDYHHFIAPCPITRLLENPSSTMDGFSQQINGEYYVIGTCKGLVCSLNYLHRSLENDYDELWARFFNPVTRVMSQESPRLCLRSSDYDITRSRKVGFGYDDSTDTCKVVAVLIDIKSQQREVRVYNLGDTCWRKTLTCPLFPLLGNYGVFISGTVNWLALRTVNPSALRGNRSWDYRWKCLTSVDQLVIFSYDLKNDTYRFLLKPDGLVEVPGDNEPHLGVLNGCLCLFYDHKGTHFVVWLMREFGDSNSWTQLLNVSYEDLQIPRRDMMETFCMSGNEDVLLLSHGYSRFILYNRRDNRMYRTGNFIQKSRVLSYDYVQSLALPY